MASFLALLPQLAAHQLREGIRGSMHDRRSVPEEEGRQERTLLSGQRARFSKALTGLAFRIPGTWSLPFRLIFKLRDSIFAAPPLTFIFSLSIARSRALEAGTELELEHGLFSLICCRPESIRIWDAKLDVQRFASAHPSRRREQQ